MRRCGVFIGVERAKPLEYFRYKIIFTPNPTSNPNLVTLEISVELTKVVDSESAFDRHFSKCSWIRALLPVF